MATRIDVDRVMALMGDGAVLIDVLPSAIYEQEHLPRARNIPLETFHPDQVSDLDREAPVVLYCFDQHCDLSSRAAARFEHEGFTQVYDLIGGRATWTALGLPTEGAVGDRRRIADYVEPVTTVAVDAAIDDIPDGTGPIAVVDDSDVLIGELDPAARSLDPDTPVVQAMAPAPGTIRPELRVDDVAKRLRKDSLDHVFVTAVNGTLLGLVNLDRLHA